MEVGDILTPNEVLASWPGAVFKATDYDRSFLVIRTKTSVKSAYGHDILFFIVNYHTYLEDPLWTNSMLGTYTWEYLGRIN